MLITPVAFHTGASFSTSNTKFPGLPNQLKRRIEDAPLKCPLRPQLSLAADRRLLPFVLGIHRVFQRFARLETGNLGSFDFNWGTRLRISTSPRGPIFRCKRTKAYENNRVIFFQRVCNGIKHGINRPPGCCLRQICTSGDRIYQF